MNRVSRRSRFVLILAVILLAMLAGFCVQYCLRAGQWVTFPGSPHVYAGSNIDTGVITDREGTVLLDSTGERTYASDVTLRSATMHILGDRYGYISAPVLDEYADNLIGFDLINGVYRKSEAQSRMTMSISAEAQMKALELLNGRAGTIGVYNYQTGEILCAVTSPTYDPDNMPDVDGDTTGRYNGVYVNRFFSTTYVPGSIFKIVTAAAAIETLPDIFERTFTCEGSYIVHGQKITCQGVHGEISFENALAQSCNCAFGQIAQLLGTKTLQKYAEKVGITESLSFDGLHTPKGKFDLSDAEEGDLAWAGIGQYSDMINPCQYMALMGQIANGGKAALPHLVQQIQSGEDEKYHASAKTLSCGLKPETTQKLAEMMHNNVVNVYGAGNFPDVTVCAKSGTAELGGDVTPNAMFAGFVRDAQYPLAFIVIVENGGAGSATCAPIAGQILRVCMDHMA